MDFPTLVLLLSLILSTLVLVLRSNSSSKRLKKLPPGPFSIPIIGNILQLGQKPHEYLSKLSKTYGPLMHLKLGSVHTIVVSSPQMAKEILQKHDQVCSARNIPCAARALDHDKASIGWLPTGAKWRTYRKICKEQMFTMHKLEESEGLRQEKLQQLRDYLQKCCLSGRVVDIGEVAFVTSLNLVSATLFSIDFAHFDSNSAQEMMEALQGLMKVLGTPNLADYFPILKLIDPQGIKREAGVYFGKLLGIFDEIISKRLESRDSHRKKDLLEALLDLNQENDSYLSRNDIKHLLLDLIVAGVDTTTGSVLWAMTELLRSPEKMLKVKNELMTVVGNNKQVKESDILRLSYLNAVIKETLRRHPAGPLLVPRKAEADVEIDGYIVPKNAQIFVNIWAIGRDSSTWLNPDLFEPERFLGSKVEYRGQDFELLAFGSGRRICPGLPLAHVMVHLMVASLIHEFEWKVEPKELDLNEIFGLSLHKAVPLTAFPINNQILKHTFR